MIIISKQKTSQKYIYKLHSSRLRKAKWKLSLPLNEARENGDDIITLSSSEALRTIDSLIHDYDSDIRAKRIRKKIKELSANRGSKELISLLYNDLYKCRFQTDYLTVVFDTKKDYDYCSKHGFIVNDLHYNLFLGTTGGLKNSVVIFVSDNVYDALCEKVDAGRNKEVPIIPNKLGAYKALFCSSSTVVTPPSGVIVVQDCETIFKGQALYVDDTNSDEPEVTLLDDQEFVHNGSDGEGLVLPELARQWNGELNGDYDTPLPSGNMRGWPFCKGMLHCMDFRAFAEDVAKTYTIIDAWGHPRDVRDAQVILTTSMFKLWDAYESMEDYLENIERYDYHFALAKTAEQECDTERNLNYQFLQSYYLTDAQIRELCEPTIKEIKDILGMDYRKTLLFLRGKNMTEKNILQSDAFTYIQALIAEPEMIKDPFIRSKIHSLIKKRIQDAKIGRIKVKGNYSIVAGDPYALMQSMFGLEVTGLLKAGEMYHKHWIDRQVDEVACFRAPMTSHYNIVNLKVKNNEQLSYWFQYLPSICVINNWDNTCESLNGADHDGDLFFTTSNKILVENNRPLPAIVCVQRKANKIIPKRKDMLKSYKDAFGDEIGFTTNIITSQFEVQSHYSPDSNEFKELDYRIICGQLYQQNSIDKLKGIVSKPMPSYWYNRKENNIHPEDSPKDRKRKEFNQRIVADKKPYFMIYIYSHLRKDYTNYVKASNDKCIIWFGCTIDELLKKADTEPITEDEAEFLDHYYKFLPVGTGPCVMNRICKLFEDEFDGYLKKLNTQTDFDYSILKRDHEYNKNDYYALKKLYTEYSKKMKTLNALINSKGGFGLNVTDIINNRVMLFREAVSTAVPDPEKACDILLDLCYTNGKSKQFVWDMFGDILVQRLLERNYHQISYPVRAESGDFEYDGDSFVIETIKQIESSMFEEADCY